MKSVYIIAAAAAFVASVKAECACDPADSACLSACVGTTNNCIAQCHSNECYTSCIANHWPGAEPNHSASNTVSEMPSSTVSEPSSTSAMPSSTWTSDSTVWSSTSVWVPSSSATSAQSTSWSQPSGMPSSSTWGPGYSYSGGLPSASPTNPSSGSAGTFQVSKAAAVIAAVAAYMLQ